MLPDNDRPAAAPARAARRAGLWAALRSFLQRGRRRRERAIVDRAGLREFLVTRANYVAQASLYGYLRTRAGKNFPELFTSEAFAVPIDVARWHLWLACLSDLAVYAGGMLQRAAQDTPAAAGPPMQRILEAILAGTPAPPGAGAEFEAHAARVRARLAGCDWDAVGDDDSAFTESPLALVRWAPVFHELEQLDEEIVRNSVRFRWQDVRRELRRVLDAPAVLASVDPGSE